MKTKLLSLLKNKRRRVIIISLLMIFNVLLISTTSTKAGNGWVIGETGKISITPPVTTFGTNNWILPESTIFLLSPYNLPTFAVVDGQKKIMKEFENTVPAYTDATVAIIPYDLGVYIKSKSFINNDLSVVKRADGEDTMSLNIVRSEKQMKAVLMMDEPGTSSTYFTKGVYYDRLVDLEEKGTIKSKWKDLISGKDSVEDANRRCERVWSYITKFDGAMTVRRFKVSERIEEYLHTNELKIDPNNIGELDPKVSEKFNLRYIDFLMTVYTQARGSVAESKWETIINQYIEGISFMPKNECNIAITVGFAARGEAVVNGKTKFVNIISGCQDYIDATFGIDKEFTLTNKESADKIAKALTKDGKSTTYYDRLLESLRLSVAKQVKNKEKVERTYALDSLFGSNIVARLVEYKPIIKGTSVSWKSGTWNDADYIEHIHLKPKFYGTILVAAYNTGGAPKNTKATLKVESTIAPGKNPVEVVGRDILNDEPKLAICLDGKKENEAWNLLFDSNQYYKVQVTFTRTPTSPSINIFTKDYVSKAKTIDEKVLKSQLESGKISLGEWVDKSLLAVVIKEKQTLKYTYSAKVTIFYSNTTQTAEDMNKVEVITNSATITYIREKPPKVEKGYYISEPSAYSELKEGTIYNETFEAMAGVPTTRTLYFASGGSEFMVELEVEYDEDEIASRIYRSAFASNDCEFKEGDTAPSNMTLGDQSANLHGGGTYTKTWSGSIPNDGASATEVHTATSVAVPNYSAYNAAKTEAAAFATQVNGTVLSYTSASDNKTRNYNNWNASITTDSTSPPQNVSATVPCDERAEVSHNESSTDSEGNTTSTKVIDSEAVPCHNEMATANKSGPGSYTITVTWTVPAHVICGPCCTHVLPAVEDTWKQNLIFDTLKIIDVRVWKIESSYVDGMEEITYTPDSTVKATIKQGDPNIFYNIAAANTSQAGRLRYSLQQQQHDTVTWYENNSSGIEKRSNKCNGLSGTLCSSNPIPVAANQGHLNTWAKGILYSNPGYTNDLNHQAKAYSGVKTVSSGDSTDTVDKQTEEYNRFTTRRNMPNKVTVVSDMLILQTSSGDQAAVYFETSQTKKSQENYDDINVTFAQMWTNNNLSAAKWSKDEINIGSYNGEYYNTTTKYKGDGNGARIATAFDNDLSKISSGDELNSARVVSTKSFGAGAENKSTPSSQYRMTRPSELRILIEGIKQNPINPNGQYFANQSYVYFKNILSYTNASSATGMANFHELTTNDLGNFGYTMKSSYKVSEGKEGTVNSIVVHNPVSVEDAMIISLPSEMDQRTTLPAGSAQSLLEKISASEVCPLSPGLCEFRVHNCKYGTNIIISSFDFEKISTKALSDPVGGIEEPIVEGDGTDDNNLVFENFTTNYERLNITTNGCTASNSLERLVVEVDEENSYVELGVNADTSDITAVRVSFGTSGKSAKSYLSYSTEKDGMYQGNVEKAIDPEVINQIVEYNVSALSSWRELGTVKRLRINLDGDNTGTGIYIITKIELVPEGLNTGGVATFTGSEDDTSLIRSLIVPTSEQVMEYRLTSGFTIDKNSIFGTGRSLNVSGNGGTRLAIPLADIGISYQRATNLKIEENIYIPAISGTDNMLFSFNGIGFYVPSGKDCGYFITSEGAIRKVNSVIIGSKLKLGVVFSFGSINECKIYVNDTLVISYTTINSGGETAGGVTEDMIGDTLNIGCWSKDNAYSAKFTIDNLTITKMAGSTTHTAACYMTFIDHSYSKDYTCDQTQEFTYTGSVQAFTAPENGTYKLEAWGAQGGYNYGNSGNSGEGGYSSGEVYLKQGQTIQVYVGAKGANGSSADYTGGAFNGGGAGMDEGLTADGHQGGQGGGATDFRLSEGNIIASTDPYIGKFASLVYSGNLSKVTLDTGENAIKIARGSTHTAAALANVFKAGHTYQISFEAWTSSTSDTIYADALPESLPDYVFNISNTRKLYTTTLSSPLAELEGAAFRLFASSFALNGDVYITNIKVCDTSLSTTTATYAIGTGLYDSGSLTYGPHVNMLSGTYQVDIYGTNLSSCTVDTISRGGATSYTITNINKTKTHITYYVNITEDIIKNASQSGLEIRIFHSGIAGYSITKQTISRLEDRILVAAGGGGTGCASILSPAGEGGGLIGGTSWNSFDVYLGYQASGGTQTSGGIGMRDNVPLSGIMARSGGFGYGADASQCGGGGGGGWYGGGSSYTGGGGGGSSYIGGVDNGTTLSSVRRGEGYARITNLTHKHVDECSYTMSENNTHVHSASCINSSSLALVNALMAAENGNYKSIKALLGNTVYNSLRLDSHVIYNWNNWSPTDLKQFRALNHTKLSTSGDNLVLTSTGTDPYFDVPVNVVASSVNKIRIYARLVGVTSPNSYLFFTNEAYPNYTGSAMAIDNINSDNNWQWIEFDLADNPSWTGKINSLRFDIVGNDAGTGYVEIDQIQLIGNGSSVGGTATKVLYTYSGFSNAKKFGITDDASPATTIFDSNCIVTNGNLGGWDFILPVSINNADALTAIRITLSNRTNSTTLGVSTDRVTEYFASMTAYDGGVYQTITIDTSGMSGSISNLYFDTAAGAATGSTYVSKIELIGYGNLTVTPTESYVSGTYDAHIHTQNCIYNTTTGAWNCGNLPLNTYSDLATTVIPVQRGSGSGSQTFNYTGGIQTLTLAIGTYNFEVWGAQGGNGLGTTGGYGGYSYGIFNLTSSQQISVYVGGMGNTTAGGWNGGGNGGIDTGASQNGGGGGGASDIRIGGTALSSRVIVAGGGAGGGRDGSTGLGGGATGTSSTNYNSGYTGNPGSQTSGGAAYITYRGATNGYLGQGGNGSSGYNSAGGGGGGGGYYGGGGGTSTQDHGSGWSAGGGGGSGYIGGVASGSMQYGVRSGNGAVKISWSNTYYTGPDYVAPTNRQSYTYTQATITYVAPIAVQTTASYGFGSLNGNLTGINATIATIANLYNSIPYSINGSVNPIWGCNFAYNSHVCDSNCKEVTILTCNEPHHFGICYDYDNEICWDACGNDANHKRAEVTETEIANGSKIHVGTFICLDNYFQVYFPNRGDFYGNGAYGIENTTMYRGKGYVDNMPTLEWLREKRIRFGYDVLFNRDGIWEPCGAGEWITLPIRAGTDGSGNELNYYDFYCILANDEKIAASVEFQAEAINCISSPGGKEHPYVGDNYADIDCPTDSASGYMTNKERFMSLWAFHSAYKKSYTDVIGRIGNLIVEDTEDFRYSNFFKEISNDGWIIEGIIREVNADISKNYLSWFRNDGSYGKDIRGVTVSKDTHMYNTYGTQSWMSTAESVSLPLQGAINNVTSLTDCQLKLGYNVLFDISTIGDYQNNLQVVPYFYALNLDTNTVTPVDVYISMDKEYKPINYFGLMSEYVDANNNYTAEYYTLKEQLYDYVMNLDWDNEARRRNYTIIEEANTKYLGNSMREPVTDSSGTILTFKQLTVPYGNYYSLGTLQMLLPGVRARTFIGSSKVNTVSIIKKDTTIDVHETNIDGKFNNDFFLFNGQRWHLTLGVPSSAVFVPYRNKRHILPTDEVISADGREIAAYEEIKNGNYVILMTADIKAIGRKYVLGFDQGANNGVLRIKGKSYSFGADLPNVFAVYDAEGSAVSDIDFTGTH